MDILGLIEQLIGLFLPLVPEEALVIVLLFVVLMVVVAALLSRLLDYLKRFGLIPDGWTMRINVVLALIIQYGLFGLAAAGVEVDLGGLLGIVAASGIGTALLAKLSYYLRKLFGMAFSLSA